MYRIGKHYHKIIKNSGLLVKLYTYQMARALASVHKLGICRSDIRRIKLAFVGLPKALRLEDL